MRLDDAVVRHDRKAEACAPTAVVAERVLTFAPFFADAQGVLAPGFGIDDCLGEEFDAVKGVGHRAEDGRDALLALLRVHGVAVGEALV